MATVNATLQRQYQRQKRLTLRRREYLLFCRNRRNPKRSRIFLFLASIGSLLLVVIILARWLPMAHPKSSLQEEEPSTDWVQQYLERSHSKTLVWTCAGGGCGGIGDRILGILQAFCMAVCLDREFLVDWRDVTFSSRFQPPERLLVALDDRSSTLLRYLDGILQDDTEVIGIKTNLWMGPAIVQAYECWDDSFILNDARVLQTILKSLLVVSPEVKRLAMGMKEASGLEKNRPYIGVHLRTGHLDEKANHFSERNVNWTAFLECGFAQCCEDASDKKLPLYVVSDNEQLKRVLDQQYRTTGRLHINTLNETELKHYAKTSDRDRARSIAWAEWLILAESKCVLPTYQSKYSQSASMYAGCAMDTCNDVVIESSGSDLQHRFRVRK